MNYFDKELLILARNLPIDIAPFKNIQVKKSNANKLYKRAKKLSPQIGQRENHTNI